MKWSRFVAMSVGVAMLAAACSSGSADVAIDDPWGRTSPKVATNAAFYMSITGGDADDTLVSASADVCGMVELHETVMNDGVMSMQHLPAGIPVPAGETVSLEPGGLHVMCMNKTAELEIGQMVSVDLVFETADPMTVDVEIRDE
ncbi:MAG: copper chaperone PCu(A)C [Actinomycetota bacterium]